MSSFVVFLVFVILLWVFIKTVSYAKWTWDRKNKLGAIAIVIISLIELILPIYSLYNKE